MKSKVQSFSFLMELIIVILFFAASTTVCASFIVQAKNKQVQGTNLQNALIEAQSMIETMQAYPQADLEQLLEVEKIDENHYQKEDDLYMLEDKINDFQVLQLSFVQENDSLKIISLKTINLEE